MRKIYSDEELQYIRDNYQIMTYKEITEEINKFNEIKKTDKQVRTKASQLGLSKRKYKYNRQYFKTIDSQEKAYWLGFIYADGYINYNPSSRNGELGIGLSVIDKEHLELFNTSLEGNVPVTTRIRKESVYEGNIVKERELSEIRFYSVELVRDLINLDLVQNKTYRPEFPKVEKQYMNSFILGFFDGDGYIYNTNDNYTYVGFVNSNQTFLNYLKEYIQTELGLNTSNISQEKEFKSRFSVHGSYATKLLDILYNSSEIYLSRKYKIYQSIKKAS